jgi:hypothetical protein
MESSLQAVKTLENKMSQRTFHTQPSRRNSHRLKPGLQTTEEPN